MENKGHAGGIQTEKMDSISAECTPLKHKYDSCFNHWYSEQFLAGKWKGKDGEEPCAELFSTYRACVLKSMQEKNIEIDEVLKRILGTDEEMKAPDA